jgi:alpha-glucosidase
MLRYYFVPGPPQRALERYTQLTGRPPIPPLWSLGYHQSRWGYSSAEDVRAVARGFQERELPLNAIHLDIDYMDGFRVFTVDARRFPDLAGLVAELAGQNIRLVTIIDPGVKRDPKYFLYREGLAAGYFCRKPGGRQPQVAQVWPGATVFPDFTDPQVRSWWGTQYRRLLDQGIAGIWHDMNEPAAFAAWGDLTLPRPTRHKFDGQGGDHRRAHNLYGLLMDACAYEALREYRPDQRPWLLTRSGWAGVARYAWSWTGDIESSWAALRQTVSTLLGLGLSGIPFSGSDIGGFSGAPDAELYTRWFQLAAFTPFFRTHSAVGTPPREPWRFGEPTLSIIRAFLKLRRRLAPYLYTLAWEASQKGYPVMRPLFWAQADDPDLWSVDDAFLLGDALLVAPILEPGASSRQIRLPAGEWWSLWDGRIFKGPGVITHPAEIERIPVLVRGGSLLPLAEHPGLTLHLYPPEAGESRAQLYSDAGEGYADWRVDRFRLASTRVCLDVFHQVEGDYAFPFERIDIQLHGRPIARARIDGTEWPCERNCVRIPEINFHYLHVILGKQRGYRSPSTGV